MSAALVAGATGFTGREVVRCLCDRGMRTLAHVRPDSPLLDEWKDRFSLLGALPCDFPWEEDELTRHLIRHEITHVFSLLGTTRKRERRAAREWQVENYMTVDYGLTTLLLRAAVRAGVDRFLFLSSLGAHPKSILSYSRARGLIEEEIRASGITYTIVRPSFISGPGRDDPRPAEELGATLMDGLLDGLAFLGARKLRARYGSITNMSLATSLVRLAYDPAMANRVLEGDQL